MQNTTRRTAKPVGRTVVQSSAIAGQFLAEKRAEGFRVETKMHGSDSKRGTQPWIEIIWYEQDEA